MKFMDWGTDPWKSRPVIPNDRHVLAAAIKCQADVIVTENLRHFPASAISSFGLIAQSSDDFIAVQNGVTAESATQVAVALVRHRRRNPRVALLVKWTTLFSATCTNIFWVTESLPERTCGIGCRVRLSPARVVQARSDGFGWKD
jgi:hypothetical protein